MRKKSISINKYTSVSETEDKKTELNEITTHQKYLGHKMKKKSKEMSNLKNTKVYFDNMNSIVEKINIKTKESVKTFFQKILFIVSPIEILMMFSFFCKMTS